MLLTFLFVKIPPFTFETLKNLMVFPCIIILSSSIALFLAYVFDKRCKSGVSVDRQFFEVVYGAQIIIIGVIAYIFIFKILLGR